MANTIPGANRRIELPASHTRVTRSLPMQPSAFNKENTSSWTVSHVGGKLRLAYAGGASVDFRYNLGAPVTTGIALCGPELTDGEPWEYDKYAGDYAAVAAARHGEPTQNGFFVGVGVMNSPLFSTATEWAIRIHERDGSGTSTIRDESYKKYFLRLAAAADCKMATLLLSSSAAHTARAFNSSEAVVRSDIWYQNFVSLGGSRWWYLLVAGSVAGTAGHVEVDSAEYGGARFGV